jgi:type I restriction enzyme, S subunit
MSSNWQTKTLGEVCDFEKTPNYKNDLPYVGLEDIESNTGDFIGSKSPQKVKSITFKFTADHILYGRLRPYLNKVLLPDFEGHCSTEIFPIKPRKNLNKLFLFHWLTSSEIVKKINATCTGTRMPRANMNLFLDFKIPFPPLREQHRIVSILDKAFAAIATAKENTEKNLQRIHESFESSLKLFFSNLESNEKISKLGDVCKIVGGGTPSKANISFYQGNIPWATVRDMKFNVIKETEYKITEEAVKSSATNIIPKNSVVIATRVGLGKVCFLETDTAINQDLKGIIPRDANKLFVNYLYWWLKSISKEIIKNGAGATVQGVKLFFIESLLIPMISLPEQRRIVAKLDELSAETKKLEAGYRRKLECLEELKKSILQKAFSGEL